MTRNVARGARIGVRLDAPPTRAPRSSTMTLSTPARRSEIAVPTAEASAPTDPATDATASAAGIASVQRVPGAVREHRVDAQIMRADGVTG